MRSSPRDHLPYQWPGDRTICECGKRLIYARTKDGEIVAVTYHNQLHGDVLLFRTDTVECRAFEGATLEALRAETVPLRLMHEKCDAKQQ